MKALRATGALLLYTVPDIMAERLGGGLNLILKNGQRICKKLLQIKGVATCERCLCKKRRRLMREMLGTRALYSGGDRPPQDRADARKHNRP